MQKAKSKPVYRSTPPKRPVPHHATGGSSPVKSGRLDNFSRTKTIESKSQWAQTADEPVRLDKINRVSRSTPVTNEDGWKDGWRPEGNWKDS